jgi:hypothetical protein
MAKIVKKKPNVGQLIIEDEKQLEILAPYEQQKFIPTHIIPVTTENRLRFLERAPPSQYGISRKIVKDTDSIFEDILDVSLDRLQEALDEIESMGMIIKCDVDNGDDDYYTASPGLSWTDVVDIDCPIKKQILLTLIDNPQTFFVLYNTQKGKLAIAVNEMKSWATIPGRKVVSFLVVDNDKSLADQSAEGMLEVLKEIGEVCVLSSNTSEKVENICAKIDSYAMFGGKMPVVIVLNNPKQKSKLLTILRHIKERRAHKERPCSNLFYGCVFDEADKVYPACRDTFLDMLVTNNSALHRLGFVSATDGDLLSMDYPECANAYMYDVPDTDPNYRAMHTVDAKIKYVQHTLNEKNDSYATRILTDNKEHFSGQVLLNNGTVGYRKTIVNGAATTISMEKFANERVKDGAAAITVNMHGICVYCPGQQKKRYSTKGVRFGNLLFDIYTKLNLESRPLFIIGRRKVDRGLGFHWAPKDGTDGLIWTDMILGHIKDKDTAVQKAGRLAGKVANCPQYPRELTWWTDKDTADKIIRHNNIVDNTASQRGCSALQAFTRAEECVPILEDPNDPSSIPIVLQITSEDFNKITKTGSNWNISSILEVIKNYSSNSYLKIKDMEKNQVVCPKSDSSYDKLITSFVDAFNSKKKYTWSFRDKKNIDTYQIYLDMRSYRIIISIYYGSKLNTS